MATISEYYDEYCIKKNKDSAKNTVVPEIRANELKQPVGGKKTHELLTTISKQNASANQQTNSQLTNSQRDLSWKFNDVSEPMRADHIIMYEPIGRHLWNENNMYALGAAYPIRRELKDGENPFSSPLAVPDVHKLRYMHNNYMTPDDWY